MEIGAGPLAGCPRQGAGTLEEVRREPPAGTPLCRVHDVNCMPAARAPAVPGHRGSSAGRPSHCSGEDEGNEVGRTAAQSRESTRSVPGCRQWARAIPQMDAAVEGEEPQGLSAPTNESQPAPPRPKKPRRPSLRIAYVTAGIGRGRPGGTRGAKCASMAGQNG